MKISAMNVKIIFQENCTIIDKIGNHINEWRDYYTCHATVTGESGTEDFTAGEIVENIDIAFTVRYCKKVSAITSTNFRIVFNNELYDIVLIDHFSYKNQAVKFKCQKVRR